MALVQSITPEKCADIFEDMIFNHYSTFKTGLKTKPIIIIFKDGKIGSKFTHHYADTQKVQNAIATNLTMNYTSFKIALPRTYAEMKPVEQQISKSMKTYHHSWNNKTKNELVFICIYPAGLDNSVFLSKRSRELLENCTEVAFYTLELDL